MSILLGTVPKAGLLSKDLWLESGVRVGRLCGTVDVFLLLNSTFLDTVVACDEQGQLDFYGTFKDHPGVCIIGELLTVLARLVETGFVVRE